MSSRPWRTLAGAAVVVVLLALFPLVTNGYVRSLAYTTLLYVALAYGWNLISGYAGYLSFGQVTFFGIGAYVVALGTTNGHWNWLVCALLGGAFAAVIAVPLGYLMLRLRGPFFALGMLGLSQTALIFANSAGFTGGGSGIYLPPGSNTLPVYYFTLVVAAATFAVTLFIDGNAFGLRLRAIREDERAAATLGVNVTATKVQAFVLSAIVPGLLGGGYAWYLTYVEPSAVFSTQIELQTVVMTILGGAGTLWGPLVGGVLMSQLSEVLASRFPQGHLMLFGGLIVVLILLLPRGIVPALEDLQMRRRDAVPARTVP